MLAYRAKRVHWSFVDFHRTLLAPLRTTPARLDLLQALADGDCPAYCAAIARYLGVARQTAHEIVVGGYLTTGQRCTCTDRVLVHRSKQKALVDALCSDACAGRAPGTPGGRLARSHVIDALRTGGLDPFEQPIPQHGGANVLATIPGRVDRWVIVGAHYDHLGRMGSEALFPGANDNASGVAMMLALAEWFAKHKPKYNMLFVAFAGEEAGLLGSEWFMVDRLVQASQIKLMLNLDILGTGDDGITVVNATAQPKFFDQLVAINGERKLLAQVKARGPACNSDHCPFVKRNVPALFVYTMGGIAAYHDVLDREETLPLTEFADLYALLKEFLTTLK